MGISVGPGATGAAGTKRVVGVILGAGSSTRLGRPKQTLVLGDTTVLGWTVRAAEASSLDEVVVVVGGAAQETLASLDPQRARIVTNEAYGSGCASSLLAGLDAAVGADSIVMLLGDMPGVDTGVIDAVSSAWRTTPTWAAVTQYDNGLGHPVVFSSAAFDTLRTLHGDKAVWKIIDREPPERMARIRVRCDVPLDIDTESDYRAVCAALGVSSRW